VIEGAIARLVEREDLSAEEAQGALAEIMRGEVSRP